MLIYLNSAVALEIFYFTCVNMVVTRYFICTGWIKK